MSDIINAVKRLERAGDEHSKATKKLFEAANKVAELIEEQVPGGVELPRNYIVKRVYSNIGYSDFLIHNYQTKDEEWVDGIGACLHGDYDCRIPDQTREGVLQFAADIADGLLDEIASYLEKRTEEMKQAEAVLLEKLPRE